MRDTKTTYLNVIEAINARNFDAAPSLFAPTCKNLTPMPGEPEGIEGFRYRMHVVKSAMEDFRFDVISTVGEGNRIPSRGTLSGTHTGSFMGVAPTGRKIKIDWADQLRIE